MLLSPGAIQLTSLSRGARAIITALGRRSQEDHEFECRLDYIMRLSLKTPRRRRMKRRRRRTRMKRKKKKERGRDRGGKEAKEEGGKVSSSQSFAIEAPAPFL